LDCDPVFVEESVILPVGVELILCVEVVDGVLLDEGVADTLFDWDTEEDDV